MRALILTIAVAALAGCRTVEPIDGGESSPGAATEDLEAVANRDAQRIQSAIVMYFVHRCTYPADLEDLVADDEPGLFGGYLDEVPTDPWGEAYLYRLEENGCVILSKGPDREEGTDDDIVNRWMEYTAREGVASPPTR